MGKLYTLDQKLLTETPEIRIGERVYAVDNRQKTVEKLLKAVQENSSENGPKEALKIALGPSAAKEIDSLNMPYPAYQQLFMLVLAAVTDEDPQVLEARFRDEKSTV